MAEKWISEIWRAQGLAETFWKKKHLAVLDGFLQNGAAELLAHSIRRIEPGRWGLRLCDQDGGPRVVTPEQLAVAGATADEVARPPQASSLTNLSRTSFSYCYPCAPLSEMQEGGYLGAMGGKVVEDWIDNHLRPFLARTTGLPCDRAEEVLVTSFSSGAFLKSHTDGVGNRVLAFVLNLTQKWHPDMGGCFCYKGRKTGAWQMVPPTFNSLCVFDTTDGGVEHCVTQVASWVPPHLSRIAITGWMAKE